MTATATAASDERRLGVPLKPAGFYGRVSQDDEESIESQLAFAREVAARDGYYIPDAPGFQFSDVNVKGTTDSRPSLDALDRLITAGKHPPFDRIYVRDAKRLGRWKDPRKHDYFAVKWEFAGVWIRYCDKSEHVTFTEGVKDSDVGRYVIDKVDHVQTARDRTEIESRLYRARRRRVIHGFLPSGRPPYGLVRVLIHAETREVLRVLEPGEFTKIDGYRSSFRCGDEAELEIVRFLFDGVERGHSFRGLATDLNERKVPPPGAHWARNSVRNKYGLDNLKWYSQTVADIVKNETYTGVYTYGDRDVGPPVSSDKAQVDDRTPVRYEDFYPDPPISREQFKRVQEIIQGRNTLWTKRRATRAKFLLTGKIRCSHCMDLIHGSRMNGRGPNTKDRAYLRYVHGKNRRKGREYCVHQYKTVQAGMVEEAALKELRTLLTNPRLTELVQEEIRQLLGPKTTSGRNDRRGEIRRKIDRLTTKLDSIQEALFRAKSQTSRERLQNKDDQVGLEIDRLRAELTSLEDDDARLRDALAREVQLAVEAPELLRLLDNDGFELRRELLLRVLEYVEYDFETELLTIAVRVA